MVSSNKKQQTTNKAHYRLIANSFGLHLRNISYSFFVAKRYFVINPNFTLKPKTKCTLTNQNPIGIYTLEIDDDNF